MAAVLLLVSGCTSLPAVRSEPEVLPPIPAPEPVVALPAEPPVPSVMHVTLPSSIAERSYTVQVTALLERDSAGVKESVRVDASALLRIAFLRMDEVVRGSGTMDSFVVSTRETSRTPPAPAPIGKQSLTTAPMMIGRLPIEFHVDTLHLHVATVPPLINECEQDEATATRFTRNFLFRIPSRLSEKMSWTDSMVSFECRANIPITVKTRSEYQVDSIRLQNGVPIVTISRSMTTTAAGESRMYWRVRAVSGEGSGRQNITLDASTGAISAIIGSGVMEIEADSSRVRQEITEELTLRRPG